MKRILKAAAMILMTVLVITRTTTSAKAISEAITVTREGATYTLDVEGTLTVTGDGTTDTGATVYWQGEMDSSRLEISSVVTGTGIESIGAGAFAYMYNVQTAEIGEGVTQIGPNAFVNDGLLQNLTLPTTLQSIGSTAFGGCNALAEINLPAGLKEIGTYGFAGCGMTEITLPAGLEKIRDYAFSNCSNLQTVTFLGSNTEIGSDIFLGRAVKIRCNHGSTAAAYAKRNGLAFEYLDDAVLTQDGVTYTLDSKGLLTITGDGANGTGTNGQGIVSGLPSWMNDERYNIQQVVIGENIESITEDAQGNGTFEDITGLTRVQIAEGLQTIGKRTFLGCTDLKTIILPASLEDIESQAFDASLVSATIQGMSTGFEDDTFGSNMTRIRCYQDSLAATLANNNGMQIFYIGETETKDGITFSLDLEGTLTITGDGETGTGTNYMGRVQNLPLKTNSFRNDILKVVVGENIESVEHTCFELPNLETAEISGGVKEIGVTSFQSCGKLRAVTLGEGVETISYSAFEQCPMLKMISLPASVKEIRNAAFDTTLETVTILNDDAVIGPTAFKSQTKVRCNYDSTAGIYARANGMEAEYLDLPGDYAVRNGVLIDYVGSDTDIEIPSEYDGQTVTAIGELAFAGSGLTSVSIPGSVKTIGKSAFTNNQSLTTVSMGEGVETIGEQAFYYCNNLETVYLPSTVGSIGEHAFQNNGKLAEITLPANLTEIGYMAFSDCGSLETVTIPGGVETVGDHAFANCPELKTVTVLQGVKNLGARTFYNNGAVSALESVSLPTGLETIGDGCFAYAANLKSINLPSSLTSIGIIAFMNTGLEEVTVPAGVGELKNAVFNQCANLKTLTIQGENTTADRSAIDDGVDIYCYKGSGTMENLLGQQGYGRYQIHCIGLDDYEINEDGVLTGCNVRVGTHYLPAKQNGIPVTAIGAGAFTNDEWPWTIVIPEGVTTIESGAFSRMGHLGKVRIPSTTEELPANAFTECEMLSQAIITNPETEIDADAFGDATGMTIVCHEGSRAEAFAQSKGFSVEYLDGGLHIAEGGVLLEYTGNDTEVTIPEGVAFIAARAFSHAENLQKVNLPRSLQSISDYAFEACYSLNEMTYNGAENEWRMIPWGIGAAENQVTVYCRLLWSQKITDEDEESDIRLTLTREGVLYADGTGELQQGMMPQRIPYGIEPQEPQLRSRSASRGNEDTQMPYILEEGPEIDTTDLPLIIGEGITAIRDGAISYSPYVTTVQIPASVTEIEPRSLNHDGLMGITVSEDSLNYAAADGLLLSKDGKTLVTYPRGREGPYTVPAGVKRIGEQALHGMNVTGISLPESLETIGSNAFSYALSYDRELVLPEGVKTIEASAFECFEGPAYLIMPEGLETIGNNAFGLTNAQVIFPGSPVSIGEEEYGYSLYCYAGSSMDLWANEYCEIHEIDRAFFYEYGGTISNIPDSMNLLVGETQEFQPEISPAFFQGLGVNIRIASNSGEETQIAEIVTADGDQIIRALRPGSGTVYVSAGSETDWQEYGTTMMELAVRMPMPEISTNLTETEGTKQIEIGETLRVTLENPEAYTDTEEYRLEAQILQRTEETLEIRDSLPIETDGDEDTWSASFSTWDTTPGDYILAVVCIDRNNGWHISEMAEIPFMATTDVETGEIRVYAPETPIMTCEEYRIDFLAPGAERIELWEEETDPWCQKTEYRQHVSFDSCDNDIGEYTLYAIAYYPDRDPVTSEKVRVEVEAPYGRLGDEVRIDVPLYVEADSEFTIAAADIEEGHETIPQGMEVCVYDEEWIQRWSANVEKAQSITVPARDEEGRPVITEEGGTYRIWVRMNKRGYRPISGYYYTYTIAPEATQGVLTVNGSKQAEVLCGEEYTVTIDQMPEGVTAVAVLRAGQNDSWSYYPVTEGSTDFSQTDMSYSTATAAKICAKYTRQAIGENQDWYEIDWEGYTDTAEITVICYHTNTYESYAWYREPVISAYDKDGHTYTGTGTKQLICSTCGREMGKAEPASSKTEPHFFLNSVCEVCGYECTDHEYNQESQCRICGKWCEHEEYGETQERVTEGRYYQNDGNDKHDIYTKRLEEYKACTECGKEWILRTEMMGRTGDEPHEPGEDRICVKCGAYVCLHENVIQVTDETSTEYEWISTEQHTSVTTVKSHGACELCGRWMTGQQTSASEGEPENHTDEDGDGICDICRQSINGSYLYTVNNGKLRITGNGVIPDFEEVSDLPWYDEIDSIERVFVEGDFTEIGKNVLGGLSKTTRIDLRQRKMPTLDTETTSGVVRYYSTHESWERAPESWIYLPIFNPDWESVNQVEFHQGTGWETGRYDATGQMSYALDTRQAVELAYGGRNIFLYDIPTGNDLKVITDHWDTTWSVSFQADCAGDMSLTIGENANYGLSFDVVAPNLTLTIDGRAIDSINRILFGEGTMTYTGKIRDLYMRGSISENADRASLTVNGDVDEVNFYDSTSGAPYRGSLTVNGTVAGGSVYGSVTMSIPNISDEVVFPDMCKAELKNVSQTVITRGELTADGATDFGELTYQDFGLRYHLMPDGWRLDLRPRENSPYGSYGATLDDVEKYNDHFGTNDILWGEETEVYVWNVRDMGTLEFNGGENGEGLGRLTLRCCIAEVNCPVDKLEINQFYADTDATTVTINSSIASLGMELRKDGNKIALGEGGSVEEGYWNRFFGESRYFGRITQTGDIYDDGQLKVLSWKDGQSIRALLPSDDEVTSAAGQAATIDLNEVTESDLSDKEYDKLYEYLRDKGTGTVAAVFDISVMGVNDEGGTTEEITEVNEQQPLPLTVSNEAHGTAYILRLHEDGDEVSADELCDATDAETLEFSSHLFSKYVIIATQSSIDPDTLMTLRLPESLKRIEDNAFEGGDFEAVIIPDECTSIGREAFKDCINLKYVSYPAGIEIGEGAFDNWESLEKDER